MLLRQKCIFDLGAREDIWKTGIIGTSSERREVPVLTQNMKEIDSNVKTYFLTASELFYEEYRRLDAHPRLDKEYFIQKPCRSEELIRKLNEILLDQT